MTTILLGSTFPNTEVNTTHGKFKLHDYQGDSWLVFMSHPADFTPVCTTELGQFAANIHEFNRRNTKLMALSCDTLSRHINWSRDVMASANLSGDLPFPIIADPNRALTIRYGIIDAFAKDATGEPSTCRAVFIIDPVKTVRLSFLYPETTGRRLSEILRVLDSMQLTDNKRVFTPADWQPGDSVVLPPSANALSLTNSFRTIELPSGKGYLRFTDLKDI